MQNDLQTPDNEDEGRLVWVDSPGAECPDCAKAEAESRARRRGGYLATLKLLLAISPKSKADDRDDGNDALRSP